MSSCDKQQGVLIVDDRPENIRILGDQLAGKYHIRAATSGEKALEIVFSDDPPDLVLLDIVMPGLDGLEACRRIKANPSTAKIPVIFITARDGDDYETGGFAAGAVDYIVKPFNPVIVQARVDTHAELKRNRDLLEDLSYRDGLTGIANRRNFDEYLVKVWEFAMRDNNPVSLVMMDVDHFKAFNDNHGHQAGDDCLRSVASALAKISKRKTDLVARYGGEEFVCLLPKTSAEEALSLADSMREAVIALSIAHGFSSAGPVVSISQGIATRMPPRRSSPEGLIAGADKALYDAKQGGRNRACVDAGS